MTGLRLGRAMLASGVRESAAALSYRGVAVTCSTGCREVLSRAASSSSAAPASQSFHSLGTASREAAERDR